MEQIKAFVQFRDKNLDHQLFGALENHRDLIVVSQLDGVALSEPLDPADPFLKANFRKILTISAKTTDLEQHDAFQQLLKASACEVSPVFIPEEFVKKLNIPEGTEKTEV